MTVLQLVNNLGMVIIIGMFLLMFAALIIRARGEEYRKNEILANKLLDKLGDKIIEVAKEVTKTINGNTGKTCNAVVKPSKPQRTAFEKKLDDMIENDTYDFR